MSVILNKVDAKLVFGKVPNNFGRFLGADEYIVVNDEIMKDEEKMNLMSLSIPGGCDFDAISCKTYAKVFEDNDYYGKKTIVVFRFLEDVMKCVELGVKIDTLNCAGIYAEEKENTTAYEKALVLTPNEVEDLRKLHNAGVHLIYQPTVQEAALEVKDLLKF